MAYCQTQDTLAITDFDDWKTAIIEFDDNRRANRMRRDKEIESYLKRLRVSTSTHTNRTNYGTNSGSRGAAGGSHAASSSRTPVPKLTDEERDYLNANNGCF